MKLYLDTNIIYKYFDARVNSIRGKKKVKMPSVPKYLFENREKHEYFVSDLTRAEIFRHLHSGLGVSSHDCYTLWKGFIEAFKVKEVIVREIDFNQISDMLSKRKAKKTTPINLIHLQIAKKNKLTLLTGDKKLKDRFKIFYDEVISYPELRKSAD